MRNWQCLSCSRSSKAASLTGICGPGIKQRERVMEDFNFKDGKSHL